MNQTSNPFEKVKTTLNELITHKKTQKEALEMQLKQRENGYINVICIEIKDAKTGEELEFNPNQTFSDNFFKKMKEKIKYNKNMALVKKIESNLEKELEETNIAIRELEKINSCLNNYGINSPIKNIANFVLHINASKIATNITLEDIKIIAGSAIRFNYNYYKHNQKARNEVINSGSENRTRDMNLCLEIGKYFNKDGSILPNEDEENFKIKLNELILYPTYDYKMTTQDFKKNNLYTIEEIINSIMNDLAQKNTSKRQEDTEKQAKKELEEKRIKQNEAILKQKNIEYQKQKQKIKELSEYYKNGQIIKPYYNTSQFKKDLIEAGIDEFQASCITTKMIKFIETLSIKDVFEEHIQYFSQEDMAIIKYAQKNNIASYFLEELKATLSLLDKVENCSPDNQNILKDYLKENINNIKYSMNMSEEDIAKLIYS